MEGDNMKRVVKFGTILHHKIVIQEFNSYTQSIDIDFFTDGEHVAGWCLGQDAVDELVQKLMQVKRKSKNG